MFVVKLKHAHTTKKREDNLFKANMCDSVDIARQLKESDNPYGTLFLNCLF